jgi:hypothetical protein
MWTVYDAWENVVKFGLLNRVCLAGVRFQGAWNVVTPVVHTVASVTWLTIPRG